MIEVNFARVLFILSFCVFTGALQVNPTIEGSTQPPHQIKRKNSWNVHYCSLCTKRKARIPMNRYQHLYLNKLLESSENRVNYKSSYNEILKWQCPKHKIQRVPPMKSDSVQVCLIPPPHQCLPRAPRIDERGCIMRIADVKTFHQGLE